jgi:YVTN family beta-propeller protein
MLLKAARLIAVASGCLLFAAVTGSAQAAPERWLLALSKANHTLSVVDPSTLKVVARMPVGTDPHEVVASEDGRTAYVSIYGGGRFHEIDVLDLATDKPRPAIDTGALAGPHGLAFVGGKVWFTAEGAKVLARYDPATARIDWVKGTGQNRTHMLYVTPDQNRVYATNVESGTVSVYENTTVQMPPPPPPSADMPAPPPPPPGGPRSRIDWIQTIIPVSKGCEGFDVSPDGKELWTASANDGRVFVIDPAAKTVSVTLDAKVMGANRLKFTPDGKRVLVSSLRAGFVAVFDVVTRRLVKTVPIGRGAAGILMDPDGNRAFVACSPDKYVAVIDLAKLEVTGHLDVGGQPDGLAWAVPR